MDLSHGAIAAVIPPTAAEWYDIVHPIALALSSGLRSINTLEAGLLFALLMLVLGFLVARAIRAKHESRRRTGADTLSAKSFAAGARVAPERSRGVRLVAHVGIQDRDILPHWLAHYRALGVGDIHLVLHGPWRSCGFPAGADGDFGDGVIIADEYEGPFEEAIKTARLTRAVQRFVGDWVLVADADEFLELPFSTLAATLRALRGFGMTSLPAILLQRVAADGRLHEVDATTDLAATFPLATPLLVERMSRDGIPPWKTKHSLFLVRADTVVRRGHHLAPDETGISGFGLQAVVHHFKWRASLLRSLSERGRNDRANGGEMRVVAEWLARHDNVLPIDDAFPCSRDLLVSRGLLRRPTRSDVALGLLLHRLRRQADGELAPRPAARLTRRLERLDAAWRELADGRRPDRLPVSAPALAMRRADIALVTFEMSPPDRTSGVATWVVSAAASLKRLGHRVTVVYLPFRDSPIDDSQRDVWISRGIEVLSLMPARQWEWDDGTRLLRLLADRRFDIIHLSDAGGLGVMATAARRQGLAFDSSRFVVTAHGPTDWHNRGNDLRWSESEIRQAHAERRQAEYADAIVAPNSAMARWMESAGYRLASPIPVHPNLLGHESWTGRRAPAAATAPIRRIVFFGRLEPRKGLALFCDAIDAVAESLDRALDVVFLGRPGSPAVVDYLSVRRARWPLRTLHFGNWTSDEALLFLREPGTLAVIPSITDNYPYTVLECLGSGIPFVATTVGGIPEMVHADDHGRVLVPPEKAALADAIRRAVTDAHAPARPADDFGTVELQWLAWHGAILADAAVEQEAPGATLPAASVIVMPTAGAGEPSCLTTLTRQIDATIEILVAHHVADNADSPPAAALPAAETSPATIRSIEVAGAGPPARAANLLAGHGRHDFLVFCAARVEADPRAVAVLAYAARRLGADAMVASHRLVHRTVATIGAPTTTTEVVHPPAGPLAIAAVDDVYGGHFFLIRRQTFFDLGGFRELDSLCGVEHRDLLNRLLLRGGIVASVPDPLYTEHVTADTPQSALLGHACLEPFLEGSPRWQRDLLSLVVDSRSPWQPECLRPSPVERLTCIRSTTLLRRWATAAELAVLRPAGDAELAVENDWLTLIANGPDPILILPPLHPAPAAPIHVLIDLLVPEPTDAQLFWSTPEVPSYCENHSVRASVNGGRQIVALTTPATELAGRLRIDPGTRAGRYVIYGVEIWAGEVSG